MGRRVKRPSIKFYARVVKSPYRLAFHCISCCVPIACFLFLVTFTVIVFRKSAFSSYLHLDQISLNGSSQILSLVPKVIVQFLTSRPHNIFKHVQAPRQPTIEEIKRNISVYNSAQTVLNADIFGPVLNDSVIIVVQVHMRLMYLRHLIKSLALARDIEHTLIVFSHDYYDEEINELVQSVDFAKVMQIFYPHSIQTHPHEFPGESPGDCPRDITIEQAIITNCKNALSPDSFGAYRDAKVTQAKHHWWWMTNTVFHGLHLTRNHNGLVLFLEEDQVVVQDFLHCLRLMEGMTRTSCPTCNVLSLGIPLTPYNYYYYNTEKADVMLWLGNKHNMGFAMNRSVWLGLQRCARFFCLYDDYTWEWSLQFVSLNCMLQKLQTLTMRGPRVFHVGECEKEPKCDSTALIFKIQKVLDEAVEHLYPVNITLTKDFKMNYNLYKKRYSGGWGDRRDHELCLNMTLSNHSSLNKTSEFTAEPWWT